jgi:hypothetical protein
MVLSLIIFIPNFPEMRMLFRHLTEFSTGFSLLAQIFFSFFQKLRFLNHCTTVSSKATNLRRFPSAEDCAVARHLSDFISRPAIRSKKIGLCKMRKG